ncbi:hypothetical protein HPB52_019947 [Rhipicephalus sanguineus]|uniref:Uncharacterized protein n=1 Tax=Rhipicephalus sanguineus TaxID=34632 RepID=A0A9D4PM08_RHISA|nr:hypothetical protein HPB52_019947 [Rhipicephalus sanguineus]
MALPRITGRQMQRSNVPSATPEEYYRRNVYLPLLADFENQLRERFDAHKKVVVGLNMLPPKFCASASLSDIDDAVQFYLGDIPSANVIEAECTLWPAFYPGDFTRVDVDPGTDFFHTEKAEELPSKSYERRQIDRTSTAQHPSRTSSDPRTTPRVAAARVIPSWHVVNAALCEQSNDTAERAARDATLRPPSGHFAAPPSAQNVTHGTTYGLVTPTPAPAILPNQTVKQSAEMVTAPKECQRANNYQRCRPGARNTATCARSSPFTHSSVKGLPAV